MARILVVDDEETQRMRMSKILRSYGHEVAEARDGFDALAKMNDQVFQIIITDWSMPNMNGLELCKAIRASDHAESVYIIFVTLHNETSYVVEGMTAGADEFIAKPVQAAELMVRVQAERNLSLNANNLVIFAMAKLAESRDPETGQHLERVQTYCQILAEHLRLQKVFPEIDASFVQLLYETCPLHDIGKVAIPDGILRKPGKLTDDEFEIMKTHTTVGAETLQAALARRPMARFLKMAADIAATHHEKFDGTGYPQRLEGEAIPLVGRIVALADVYDALTSRRCYKEPIPHETADRILRAEDGRHSDPRILEAYVAAEAQFNRIREQLQNPD